MIRDKLEKFTFGKYRNKTIMWVMNNDPHYLLWSYYNIPTVDFSDSILLETIKTTKQLQSYG